jgi:hypothetical protein
LGILTIYPRNGPKSLKTVKFGSKTGQKNRHKRPADPKIFTETAKFLKFNRNLSIYRKNLKKHEIPGKKYKFPKFWRFGRFGTGIRELAPTPVPGKEIRGIAETPVYPPSGTPPTPPTPLPPETTPWNPEFHPSGHPPWKWSNFGNPGGRGGRGGPEGGSAGGCCNPPYQKFENPEAEIVKFH